MITLKTQATPLNQLFYLFIWLSWFTDKSHSEKKAI